MSLTRRHLVAVLLAGLVAASVARTAHAQGPLAVNGRVMRETLDGPRAVAGEQVTLHRVNARDAGPVDSVMTDRRGGFAFRVPAPDSMSMYLVSARYGGIAYFSQPLQGSEPGTPADVTVYDTTSADVRVQLQGRHVVVSAPAATGVRSVIDVLEIANDTILTRVPGTSNRPTYSMLLPDGVLNVRVAQGEISAGAVEVRDGRADLFAPLSPGLRQVVLTYDLPPGAMPLAVPLEHAITVLEVLLEERGAGASAPGLENKGDVSVDGKTFTRFLGEAANEGTVLTLTAPRGAGGSGVPPWLLPLVLTLITMGAILVGARRRTASPGVPVHQAIAQANAQANAEANARGRTSRTVTPIAPRAASSVTSAPDGSPSPLAIRLARQVASIDALLERTPASDAEVRADLVAERARVRSKLVAALAPRTRVP